MKLSELTTHAEVLAADLDRDPALRQKWERTAIGRLLAIELIRYRAEHDLSQRDLAKRLEMPQSQVARLELGEHNPRYQTILRLVDKLGIELLIDIRPSGQEAKLLKKRAAANSIQSAEFEIAVATA